MKLSEVPQICKPEGDRLDGTPLGLVTFSAGELRQA